MKDYIKDALKISEFKIILNNISASDNKSIESYTLEELQREAKYLIEKLQMDIDDTCDEETKAIKDIKTQMLKVNKWIIKYI